MNKLKAEQEVVEKEVAEEAAPEVRGDWRALMNKLSYRAVVGSIPYLAFVALLCMLYIANTQRATDIQRALNKHHSQMKELRWKYMDINTQLLYVGMEAEVIKNASAIGLKPLELPAYKIEPERKKPASN